jgi:hypothetical protein
MTESEAKKKSADDGVKTPDTKNDEVSEDETGKKKESNSSESEE